MRTIRWDSGTITTVDQTLLPVEYRAIECKTVHTLCEAIVSLRIRGAPALGAAGGYGVALAAHTSTASTLSELMRDLENESDRIRKTRPTAINLTWGVDRVIAAVRRAGSIDEARRIALFEATAIADEDVGRNTRLSRHGEALLEDGVSVLSDFNVGRLA